MKHLCILILTALVYFSASSAHADVIPNSCISAESGAWSNLDGAQVWGEVHGIRCENIRAIAEGATISAIGLTTIQAGLSNAVIAASVEAQLAALGATVAGAPTIAAVTIFGAFGFATVRFLLTNSLSECDRMDDAERDRLIRSLEEQVGALRSQQLKIQIQH